MAFHPKKSENTIPLNLLQVLRDCSSSTLRGFIDRGNPRKLLQLSVLKLVTPKDGGYVINEEGRAYLSAHRRELAKL